MQRSSLRSSGFAIVVTAVLAVAVGVADAEPRGDLCGYDTRQADRRKAVRLLESGATEGEELGMVVPKAALEIFPTLKKQYDRASVKLYVPRRYGYQMKWQPSWSVTQLSRSIAIKEEFLNDLITLKRCVVLWDLSSGSRAKLLDGQVAERLREFKQEVSVLKAIEVDLERLNSRLQTSHISHLSAIEQTAEIVGDHVRGLPDLVAEALLGVIRDAAANLRRATTGSERSAVWANLVYDMRQLRIVQEMILARVERDAAAIPNMLETSSDNLMIKLLRPLDEAILLNQAVLSAEREELERLRR